MHDVHEIKFKHCIKKIKEKPLCIRELSMFNINDSKYIKQIFKIHKYKKKCYSVKAN